MRVLAIYGKICLVMKIGSCIVKARESVGVSQRELGRRCEIKPSEICQIENGRVIPRFDRVERFAAALEMSVVEMLSFADPDPVRRVNPKRKSSDDYLALAGEVRGVSAAIALAVEADAKDHAENPRKVCSTRLNFLSERKRLNGAAVSLAEKMRAAVGLGKISNADLEDLLIIKGVRIFRAKLPAKTQSIALWSARRRRITIVLNAANTPERNRFRLAFELATAHVFFATKAAVDVDHVVNRRFLKEFTSSFLMPAESVRQLVDARGLTPKSWTFDSLLSLKSAFAVSAESFALRLDELGLITNSLRLKFREQLLDYYKKNPKAPEPIS